VEQLLEFVGNHPILVGSFVVLAVLLIAHEASRGGRAVSPQELVDLVNRKDAVVVDLRERREYEAGHIVDALHVPHHALESRMDELEPYKDRPVILACRMGQNAGAAGAVLRKAGFENVLRLNGGMMEWQNASLPLVRSGAST
jgi:rhodanese-related sulfurtransferase